MAQRLKELREAQRWSKTEFAKQCGITRQYLWMLENTDRIPSRKVTLKIAKVLGTEANVLFKLWEG